MSFDIKGLIAEREAERYELHASHLNEQMVHVLKTIGFDKRYQRGVGQYLYDEQGERYLDLLSGWGVFAVGRNHPTVREALTAVLDSELPNLVQMGVSALSGVLAERLLEFVPHLDKVFFSNSGTEAVESAIKFARAATRRSGIVYCSHAFHGLTYGSLSLNGDQNFRTGFGPLLLSASRSLQRSCCLGAGVGSRTAAASLSSRSKEKASSFRTTAICKERLSSAENTEPCSSPTKSRPGSVGPAGFEPLGIAVWSTSVFSRRRAPRWAGHTTGTGDRSHKAAGRFFRANRWGRPSRLAMSGLIAAHNRERNSLANLLLLRCYSIAT